MPDNWEGPDDWGGEMGRLMYTEWVERLCCLFLVDPGC